MMSHIARLMGQVALVYVHIIYNRARRLHIHLAVPCSCEEFGDSNVFSYCKKVL